MSIVSVVDRNTVRFIDGRARDRLPRCPSGDRGATSRCLPPSGRSPASSRAGPRPPTPRRARCTSRWTCPTRSGTSPWAPPAKRTSTSASPRRPPNPPLRGHRARPQGDGLHPRRRRGARPDGGGPGRARRQPLRRHRPRGRRADRHRGARAPQRRRPGARKEGPRRRSRRPPGRRAPTVAPARPLPPPASRRTANDRPLAPQPHRHPDALHRARGLRRRW